MGTPIVIEITRRPQPVEHDPFLDDLRAAYVRPVALRIPQGAGWGNRSRLQGVPPMLGCRSQTAESLIRKAPAVPAGRERGTQNSGRIARLCVAQLFQREPVS